MLAGPMEPWLGPYMEPWLDHYTEAEIALLEEMLGDRSAALCVVATSSGTSCAYLPYPSVRAPGIQPPSGL